MRKIMLILFTVFLNMGLFSCTPQALEDATQETQACCEDGDILPPPPPPPPPPGDGD